MLNARGAPADTSTMTTSSRRNLSATALAAAAPGTLWLVGAHGTARAIALVAGVGLVTWGSARLARHDINDMAWPAALPAAELDLAQCAIAPARLDRTPTGRWSRDVGCPAHATGAGARRSTRR
jgi:hypothetical protein